MRVSFTKKQVTALHYALDILESDYSEERDEENDVHKEIKQIRDKLLDAAIKEENKKLKTQYARRR